MKRRGMQPEGIMLMPLLTVVVVIGVITIDQIIFRTRNLIHRTQVSRIANP
jgi:hypothetical protein